MQLTHEETAWLLNLPLVATLIVVLIGVGTLATTRFGLAAVRLLDVRRILSRDHSAAAIELVYVPDIIRPGLLVASALLAMALGGVAGALTSNVALGIALSAGLAGITVALALYLAEQRYIDRVDRALVQAVGRLATQMRAGQGFSVALDSVAAQLPPGPLKQEWTWIVRTCGAPTSAGIATDAMVCRALSVQTPSKRHASFLVHLETALQSSHQECTRMIGAAYDAMVKSQKMRADMDAELAQMRNSGVVLFLANAIIIIYLAVVQWDRFLTAYSSSFGVVVGPIIAVAMLSPLIGGYFLSKFDDVVY